MCLNNVEWLCALRLTVHWGKRHQLNSPMSSMTAVKRAVKRRWAVLWELLMRTWPSLGVQYGSKEVQWELRLSRKGSSRRAFWAVGTGTAKALCWLAARPFWKSHWLVGRDVRSWLIDYSTRGHNPCLCSFPQNDHSSLSSLSTRVIIRDATCNFTCRLAHCVTNSRATHCVRCLGLPFCKTFSIKQCLITLRWECRESRGSQQ